MLELNNPDNSYYDPMVQDQPLLEDYSVQRSNVNTEIVQNTPDVEAVSPHTQTCCTAMLTGLLGCLWGRRYRRGKHTKCDTLWLGILLVTSVVSIFLLYYWIMAANSSNDFSWFLFQNTGRWIPVQLIAVILSAVMCGYITLLCSLTLCHLGRGLRLYLSVCHRVSLVLCLCVTFTLLAYMTHQWPRGWKLMQLSLMITGPFLHIVFVTLVTGCSWFVIGSIFHNLRKNKKVAGVLCGACLFMLTLLGLYLLPLALKSPCVCDMHDLPQKPGIFAHRGAAAIAPENTVLSFKKAGQFEETVAFESDVTVSTDGVPFLMHDATLRRTTDVAKKFPGRESDPASSFNISEIRSLNAGSWFLQQDSFGTVSLLSAEDRDTIQNSLQVTTLEEYLDLAVLYNKSVMFDLEPYDTNGDMSPQHPYYKTYQDVIISTVVQHNISQDRVYWLYDDLLNSSVEHHFTHMYGKDADMSVLLSLKDVPASVSFVHASTSQVRTFQKNQLTLNVWVINSPWLYSLYWCVGVDLITSNHVHSFSGMDTPVWHLTPGQYLGMWVGTDALSLCVIIVIIIIQRRRHPGTRSSQELLSLADRDLTGWDDQDVLA